MGKTLSILRDGMQIPPGETQPLIRVSGNPPRLSPAVTENLDRRASLWVPPASDFYAAKDIAETINAQADAELIPIKETLENLDWRASQYQPLVRALGVLGVAYERASGPMDTRSKRRRERHIERQRITPDTQDANLTFTQASGEYLASRALLRASTSKKLSGSDPALYLSTAELAALRREFSAEHIDNHDFFFGLHLVASRKYRIPDYLALLYDKPKEVRYSTAHTVYRELVLGETLKCYDLELDLDPLIVEYLASLPPGQSDLATILGTGSTGSRRTKRR